jgi:hypothetical protein
MSVYKVPLFQEIINLHTTSNGRICDAHGVSGEPIPLPSVGQLLVERNSFKGISMLEMISPDKRLRPESGPEYPGCAIFLDSGG